MTAPPEDPLVCRCYKVREGVIRKAIRERELRLVEEVTACTRAAGGCSSCWDDVQRLLNEAWGRTPARHGPEVPGLADAEKRSRVRRLLEDELRPFLDANGLQVQLVEVGGDRALVRFSGGATGTELPSFLSIKRFLVRRMSDVCNQKMQMIELNVLEALAKETERQ